jgi:hypothetical protein
LGQRRRADRKSGGDGGGGGGQQQASQPSHRQEQPEEVLEDGSGMLMVEFVWMEERTVNDWEMVELDKPSSIIFDTLMR